MKTLLETWRDNSLAEFAIALGVLLAALLAMGAVLYGVSRIIGAIARRTASPAGKSAADAIRGTQLWLLLPLALLAAVSILETPERLDHALRLAASIGLAIQAGVWTSRMIRDWLDRKTSLAAGVDGAAVSAFALLGFAARVLVWTLVLLLILDHLGFNITALVTGLGIGGIAIALAVQNILGDLFASLSIVLDKPFVVGDFIMVDDLAGTVQRIGVKTTRVKSLGGEMLVFSNSDLLKSRIRNFRHLTERRVAFSVGVTYQTPAEKVRAIPATLRAAVEACEKTRFDRAHFKSFGDSALVFEVVYFVLAPEFNRFMDIQQEINLAILDRFGAEGIDLAYPTQTLHIATAPPADVPASPGAPRPDQPSTLSGFSR